ncbi:hypothetical protein B5P44_00805 [Mycobacterium sp. CBMA 213]|uniref:Uncharacterized protein n=1 Tax=Mycolicibacterium sp. CBMA 213 TaxID=1968788 RepID=A0A343VRE7_9MYCO|nr:hypothetical protein [Mycolicibacterium sp. CBMA 213]AVN58471.1 hypothetical protein B5P44_p00176 [Mycolicibacterium sp. CBMA 213]MUM03362.1 hypothetical protein [Mycolicibacterium sp. CBMA 213]
MVSTDSLADAAGYALGVAYDDTLPATAEKYEVIRAALLLPALWHARVGTLIPGWRQQLPVPAHAGQGPMEMFAAAMELAWLPAQPWERGGDPEVAFDAWFHAAQSSAIAITKYAYEAFRSGHGSLETVKACHAACVLTDASYLAAGGGRYSLPATRGSSPLDIGAPECITDDDKERVYQQAPAGWYTMSAAPVPGRGPQTPAARREWDEVSFRSAARQRLARW